MDVKWRVWMTRFGGESNMQTGGNAVAGLGWRYETEERPCDPYERIRTNSNGVEEGSIAVETADLDKPSPYIACNYSIRHFTRSILAVSASGVVLASLCKEEREKRRERGG